LEINGPPREKDVIQIVEIAKVLVSKVKG